MHKNLITACLFLAVAVSAQAQTQIATVTSSASFSLRGAAVTTGQGVPTWPILAGDNLKAGNALTIVTFPDGSVLTLDPQSEAKIDIVGGKPVFQLLSGTARYSLMSTSAVTLMAANQTVNPRGNTGILRLSNRRAGGAAGAAGGAAGATGGGAAGAAGGAAAGAAAGISATTAVVAGVAAAAAAGLGAAAGTGAIGGGSPVSIVQ